MPTLFVDEQKWAPRSLGLNNEIAVKLQREYAIEEKDYPVWGISPCTVPNGKGDKYSEFGVAQLGAKGYEEKGIITPHVSFLALTIEPEEAVANIREMMARYDIYGSYGFYDAVQVATQDVAYTYLGLDQGMILIAAANYLKENCIQRLFEQDKGMQKTLELIGQERSREEVCDANRANWHRAAYVWVGARDVGCRFC